MVTMKIHSLLSLLARLIVLITFTDAFVLQTSPLFICNNNVINNNSNNIAASSKTALGFGIPSFLIPNNEEDDDKKAKTKNTSSKIKDSNNKKTAGAVQKGKDTEKEKTIGIKALVQLIAAGAGAPFLGDFEGIDKETGKFMFSLEANNLVDDNGNSKQTQMPYFENGWVDENDTGFQWPWEQKQKQKQTNKK